MKQNCEKPLNQCDGCRRQLPIENGIHVDPKITGWGRLYMVCEKDRYNERVGSSVGAGVGGMRDLLHGGLGKRRVEQSDG